jgi:uncharacterized protein YggE
MKRIIIVPVLFAITLAVILVSPGLPSPMSSTSSAQTSDQPSGTVSVYGVGIAVQPAEELTLQIVVEYWEEGYRGEPETPADKVGPVIDAMIDAGIDEDAIDVSAGFSGYEGIVRVTVQLEDPELEQVQEVFVEIEEAIRYEELYIVHVGGFYEYDDCSTLESEAYATAVEDARERADRLAETLDMDLGEVVDATDESRTTSTGSRAASSCDPPAIAGPMDYFESMLTGSYATFDPEAEIEVRIVRVVHLTFATE